MKNLIYYPGFEVKDTNWLKFALLYIEHLDPIIPKTGNAHLSEFYHKLMSETDLIRPHDPSHKEGIRATLDAIQVVERILISPKIFESIFYTKNIIEIWRNREFQRYSLFAGKFTKAWEEFCLDHGLARRMDYGLYMEESLSFVYMSLLAHIIGESRGISPITDHLNFDRFGILSRQIDKPDAEMLNIAKKVIEIQLPANISEISIDTIIRFRNRPGFKTKLRAFHTELDKFFGDGDGDSGEVKYGEDFINSFNSVWQEFSTEVLELGLGVATVTLGAWVLASTQTAGLAEYLKEFLVPAISLVPGTIIAVNSWEHTATRRYTKKYLAELATLGQ